MTAWAAETPAEKGCFKLVKQQKQQKSASPALSNTSTNPTSTQSAIEYSFKTYSLSSQLTQRMSNSPNETPPTEAQSQSQSPLDHPPHRRGAQLDPIMRTKITTLKLVAGWSYSQIAKHYSIPLSTVKKTVSMHEKRGYTNETLSRSGRPQKLSEEERQFIFESVRKDPNVKLKVLLDGVDNKISKSSLCRLLKKGDAMEKDKDKDSAKSAN